MHAVPPSPPFLPRQLIAIALGLQPGGWRAFRRAFGALTLLCVLAAQPKSAAADLFLEVTVSNRFSTQAPHAPVLQTRLREPAIVDLLLYDLDGRLQGWQSSSEPATGHRLELKDLPRSTRGVNLYYLVASDREGRRLDHYPKQPGGGEVLQVADATLDPASQTIRYLLPQAAFVRIRVGFQDGPYLEPLLPWQPQPAGPQAIRWNGTSQSGLFTNMYRHPNRQVLVSAVSLPVNALVQSTNPPARLVTVAPPSLPNHLTDLAQAPWPAWQKARHRTFGMPVLPDFRLRMDLQPDSTNRTVQIRVDCAPEDRARVLNQRFEIMLFLDALFVMEDERGLLPFSYRMSTRGIPPGDHALTVNVIDIDGNLGTVSRVLTVSGPAGGSL